MANDGTKLDVDNIFIATYPVLYNSLYVVGDKGKDQESFNEHIVHFTKSAYKHYKPIGVATTGQKYIHDSDINQLSGVIFANGKRNFNEKFVTAIAKQRLWDR